MITLEERAPSALALTIAEALEQMIAKAILDLDIPTKLMSQAVTEATTDLMARIEVLELQAEDLAKDLERFESTIPDEIENQIDSALEGLSVELTRR